jgi:hypothetical protein
MEEQKNVKLIQIVHICGEINQETMERLGEAINSGFEIISNDTDWVDDGRGNKVAKIICVMGLWGTDEQLEQILQNQSSEA